VKDVQTFFEQHYTPASASLVIAGDVRAGDAKALAARYFGAIPSPPNAAGVKPPAPEPPPKLGKVVRETIEDKVEMTKIVMAFHSPAHFERGDAELDILASILSSGKTSRLYKTLVYDKALAQSVEATQQSMALSSIFSVEVLIRPTVSADVVEKITDALLAEATARPPTNEEMQRAKNQIAFDFVDRLQSIATRARLLNMYWAERGDPGYVTQDLARYDRVTAEDVLAQAKKTITLNGRVILTVVPAGGASAAAAEKAKGGKEPPAQGQQPAGSASPAAGAQPGGRQ
jgi:zinc protease